MSERVKFSIMEGNKMEKTVPITKVVKQRCYMFSMMKKVKN
jgi:hypothetical protein